LGYDLLDIVSGMDASKQATGIEVFERSLQSFGCTPAHNFINKKDFSEYLKEIETLIIKLVAILKINQLDK